MKRNLFNLTLFTLIVTFFISCTSAEPKKEDNTTENEAVQEDAPEEELTFFESHQLHYFDADRSEDIAISHENFLRFLAKTLELSEETRFAETEVINDPAGYMYLQTIAEDDLAKYKIHIGLTDIPEKGYPNLRLKDKLCACTSSDCNEDGCVPMLNNGECVCSDCGTDCLKTSVAVKYSADMFR